jgi:hypothetical protein
MIFVSRYLCIASAAFLPSLIAHTTRDWPRRPWGRSHVVSFRGGFEGETIHGDSGVVDEILFGTSQSDSDQDHITLDEPLRIGHCFRSAVHPLALNRPQSSDLAIIRSDKFLSHHIVLTRVRSLFRMRL